VRHGKGRATEPDGSEYDGTWCDGVRAGVGKLRNSSGDVWEGPMEVRQATIQPHHPWRHLSLCSPAPRSFWQGGVMAGEGVLRYADGDRTRSLERTFPPRRC
jgi:hypothetical protein